MSLQGYYNRFDSTDNFDSLDFRASKGLQSAELNELQSILSDRLTKIAGAIFQDGSIVRGGAAVLDPATGDVIMNAGAIFVLGAVREVAQATFQIPTTGGLQIGIRVVTSTVTELEDASLRDPATGTRNYQEPGAGRTKREISWGWSGDGATGDFYGVYDVLNGALVQAFDPPELDSVKRLVARYDYDANGSYIVRGHRVTALGKDVTQSNYIFTVAEGVANITGKKVSKPTATRLSYTIDPDLQSIANEPKVSSGAGTQTITVNRKPLNAVQDVVITEEKTVTLTHGSFTGALDVLPDTSILQIISVSQGATTYAAGNDYNLTADQVDWTPSGAEPAPGSTYSVTYQYLTSVTPQNIDPDAGTFEVTGAVASSLVLVDYNWKMPRIDRIVLDGDGYFHRIRGTSTAFQPEAPLIPADMLGIANYYQDWLSYSTPLVDNDGIRVTSMREQTQMKEAIVDLYELVADERLQRDISSREPTAKFGLFTDPFIDGDLRDAGVSQDAVIVAEELQLAVNGSPVRPSQNNDSFQLLPYTQAPIVTQSLSTGFMKVNPYGNFDPIPAVVELDPAIDLWIVTDEQTTFSTQSFTTGWGNRSSTTVSTVTNLVFENQQNIETLRQTTVDFRVEGFDAGENLDNIEFDGQDLGNNGETADNTGLVTGSFTVPAGIPAGSKEVRFLGDQGSLGMATYTGQGTLITRRFNQVTTTTTNFWWQPPVWWGWDPLAQSFSLDESRHVTSVDIFMHDVGTKDLVVQLRESDNGQPTREALLQVRVKASDLNTSGATRVDFPFPIYLNAEQEYWLVFLTDDQDHSMRVAELGKFDSTANQWVSQQPYTIGVLLSSSNASSWTVHNDMDLKFQINVAEFTATSQTINLGSLTVSNMTDLLVTAPVDVPGDQTRVSFRYTRSTGEIFNLAPDQSIPLEASISDTIQVQAVLEGTTKESPILYPGVLSLPGTLDTTGTYVGREFDVTSGASTMRVVYEAKLESGAAVTPQYDNGGFQNLSLASATQVGDGWVEYVYEDTGISGMSATKVKLTLTGSAAGRPLVRKLRAVMV
tara:strand:- start:21244 stop:24399 length:3156 start_codon:yes stop_codon:yes gene_type:complete